MNKSLWIILLLKFALVVPSFAGGISTVGGGSGVACFATEEVAKAYQSLITNNEELPESFFNDMQSLVTLETWERDIPNSELIKPLNTWQETLDRVHQHIYYISPLFLFRLKQFADIAKKTEWKMVNKLDLLEDATPLKKIDGNCLRVQIAKRYSEQKTDTSSGPTPNFLVAKIEFNDRLFSKLSIMDQTILILHEQLYLIGGSVGHVDSNFIRKFVNLFIIDRHIDPLKLSHFYSSREIFTTRWRLVTFFGDYPVYFSKEKLPEKILEKAKKAFTSQSRFMSFMEVLLQLRNKVGQCREYNEKNESSKIPDCLEYSVQGLWKENNLSDEQAFAFVSFFGVDRSLGMNSEYLFDPSLNEMSEKDSQASVFVFCNEIFGEIKPVAPFYKQALQYCQKSQAKVNTSTKKTGQN